MDGETRKLPSRELKRKGKSKTKRIWEPEAGIRVPVKRSDRGTLLTLLVQVRDQSDVGTQKFYFRGQSCLQGGYWRTTETREKFYLKGVVLQ